MRLYELLALERRLLNLKYSFEIVKINRDFSYFHEWSDVPFSEIEKISISGHDVCETVDGKKCSWLKIYFIVDSLIPRLKNPNERYLSGFCIKDKELIIVLDS